MKENLNSVGFEPTTSGLDLPMLCRLSYGARTGAGRCNLGERVAVNIQVMRIVKRRQIVRLDYLASFSALGSKHYGTISMWLSTEHYMKGMSMIIALTDGSRYF